MNSRKPVLEQKKKECLEKTCLKNVPSDSWISLNVQDVTHSLSINFPYFDLLSTATIFWKISKTSISTSQYIHHDKAVQFHRSQMPNKYEYNEIHIKKSQIVLCHRAEYMKPS